MATTSSKKSILLNAPNIIIYIRVLCLFLAIATCLKWGLITVLFIFIGANLDALDGFLARKLNQTSKTGAIFDFMLDRLYTTCYVLGLSILYPDLRVLFLSLLFLDLASHFAHLHYLGMSKNENHKISEHSNNAIFKLYYSSRPFLYLSCLSYDLCFGVFYLMHWYHSNLLTLAFILTAPGFLIKVYVHFIQLVSAIDCALEMDLG